MLAFWIVEHLDVIEHILPGFGAGLVDAPAYALALEQVKEALGDGIVVTVPAPAHRVLQIVRLDE